jgi:hypothetical protein
MVGQPGPAVPEGPTPPGGAERSGEIPKTPSYHLPAGRDVLAGQRSHETNCRSAGPERAAPPRDESCGPHAHTGELGRTELDILAMPWLLMSLPGGRW